METEQTLVLIKPDGVQRGLIGEIIARYEHKGLKIVGMKLQQLPRDTAEELYATSIKENLFTMSLSNS